MQFRKAVRFRTGDLRDIVQESCGIQDRRSERYSSGKL